MSPALPLSSCSWAAMPPSLSNCALSQPHHNGLFIEERHSGKHHCSVPASPQHSLVLVLESDGGMVSQKRDGLSFEGVRYASDISIIPAGSSGHCHCEAHSRAIQIMLPPSLLNDVAATAVQSDDWNLSVRFNARDDKLRQLILLLHQEAKESQNATDARGDELMFDSLTTALAVQLLRHHSYVHATTEEPACELCGGLSLRAQRQIVEYVQDNLTGEVRLDDMASVVGLSRYHFLRAFKASMGLTPHQYVIQQRVELAKKMMAQNRFSLREIAYSCGFGDQSHLTRHFRRLTGATPKAFGARLAD
ncbi:AraC family transcriptional regulator [bacterium]|nr:MAG: AraC family transcriptional regulator [bacterium]